MPDGAGVYAGGVICRRAEKRSAFRLLWSYFHQLHAMATIYHQRWENAPKLTNDAALIRPTIIT